MSRPRMKQASRSQNFLSFPKKAEIGICDILLTMLHPFFEGAFNMYLSLFSLETITLPWVPVW